jgi:hypothetical protein
MYKHNLESGYKVRYLTESIVCFLADDKFEIFDLEKNLTIKTIKKKYPSNIIKSNNEIIVYSTISGKAIEIFDYETFTKIASINGAVRNIEKLIINSEINFAAVIETWNYLRIFDLKKRELCKAIKLKGTIQMFQVVFPDKQKIYISHYPDNHAVDFCENSYIDEIDVSSGEITATFKVPHNIITREMYFYNNQIVIIHNKRMLFINLENGEMTQTDKEYSIDSLCLENNFAVSINENYLDLYNLKSDERVYRFECEDKIINHEISINKKKIGIMTVNNFYDEILP